MYCVQDCISAANLLSAAKAATPAPGHMASGTSAAVAEAASSQACSAPSASAAPSMIISIDVPDIIEPEEPVEKQAAQQDKEEIPKAAPVRYLTRFRQHNSVLPHPTLGNVAADAGQDLLQQYKGMLRSSTRAKQQQQQQKSNNNGTVNTGSVGVEKRARVSDATTADKRARTDEYSSSTKGHTTTRSNRQRSSSLPPTSNAAAAPVRGRPVNAENVTASTRRSSSANSACRSNIEDSKGRNSSSGSSRGGGSSRGRPPMAAKPASVVVSAAQATAAATEVQELITGSGIYEAERIEAERFDRRSKQV